MELPTYESGGILGTASATADLVSAPASSLRAVVPSDGANLPDGVARALWVGAQGDISIVAEGDAAAVTLTGVVGLVPVRTKAVRLAGTTATGIVALY